MGAFEYTALDAGGRSHKGVLEGDTPRQVRQQLRSKGWTPLAVEEVRRRAVRQERRWLSMRRGLSVSDLALLTRQLATLVGSGMPVEESLRVASQQTDKARLKGILMGVRSRVVEGHSLMRALGDFPEAFPELYRATVAAGEQSGYLDRVLVRLADYAEERQILSQRVTGALIYPVILVVVAIAIVGLLLGYVVPQVLQVFDSIGQELPLLTRLLIAISEFTQAWGLPIFVLLMAGVLAFRWLLRRPAARRAWDGFLLRLPLVAKMARGLNTARFARTFSILAASGVPVLEALRIAAQVMSNLPMREAVLEAADRVREGSSLHVALDKSGYFPPLTVHLIASGEATGKLEEMLDRAAAAEEREMDMLIGTLLKLFEPLMIIIMALIVLFIVMAILLPIFDMNQLVR